MKDLKKSKKTQKKEGKQNNQRKNSKIISEQISQLCSNDSIHVIKNIEIQFDQFEELFQNVDLSMCINQQTKGLSVKKLTLLLEKQFNIFTKDKMVKFFLQDGGIFIVIPVSRKCLSVFEIEKDDYCKNQTIKLQLLKNQQLIDIVMHQSQEESDDNGDDQEQDNEQKFMEGKCRRLKQRKIKHVIEKVLKWRQLYAGNFSPKIGIQNGQETPSKRVPLEQGAKIVRISKKTLDDYLSQLKKGKKYGFNFNDHKNQKIGVLRQFIRKVQKKK